MEISRFGPDDTDRLAAVRRGRQRRSRRRLAVAAPADPAQADGRLRYGWDGEVETPFLGPRRRRPGRGRLGRDHRLRQPAPGLAGRAGPPRAPAPRATAPRCSRRWSPRPRSRGRTSIGTDGWDDEVPRALRGPARPGGEEPGDQAPPAPRRGGLGRARAAARRGARPRRRRTSSSGEVAAPPTTSSRRWPRWRPRSTTPRPTTSTSRTRSSRPSGCAPTRTRQLARGHALLPHLRPAPRDRRAGRPLGRASSTGERPELGHQHDTSVVAQPPRPPARAAAQDRHEPLAARGAAPARPRSTPGTPSRTTT